MVHQLLGDAAVLRRFYTNDVQALLLYRFPIAGQLRARNRLFRARPSPPQIRGFCIDPRTIDGPGCQMGDAPDSRHHAEYRRNGPASSLPDSSPSKPTPESVAARLDVDERLLLFCIASGTDSGVLSLA